jgi:hypothetical protein
LTNGRKEPKKTNIKNDAYLLF